jgi:hypothetical protein
MFSFRPAKRSEAKPLVALYGQSGAGKSFSALLLARGFAGPSGRIGMIDTEAGRGEAYADLIPGGYDVLPLRKSFSPKTYGEAIASAEQSQLQALIIDSASHEWSGVDGVLAMAAENQLAGKKGPLVWQQPKMDHQRYFMLRVMQTPIPLVILCLRAKYPMVEKKKANGTKEWVRSEMLEPDQANDILFEAFVHGWLDQQHCLHVTKLTHPALARVFIDGEPITAATGERLAVWAKASAPGTSQAQSAEQASAGTAELPPSEPADAPITSDKINEWKRQLHVVANQGTAALAAKWKMLPKDAQHVLEIEKDKILKPMAARADAQRRARARA